jgi:4-hydroxy-3-methylbut-2-enyl diphosphate reductase IspH
MPAHRPLVVGITAGASTPNKAIGDTIERLAQLMGVPVALPG